MTNRDTREYGKRLQEKTPELSSRLPRRRTPRNDSVRPRHCLGVLFIKPAPSNGRCIPRAVRGVKRKRRSSLCMTKQSWSSSRFWPAGS